MALKDEVAVQLQDIGVAVEEIAEESLTSGTGVPSGFHLVVCLLAGERNGWGHGPNAMGVSSRAAPRKGHNAVFVFVPGVMQTLDRCSVRPFPHVVGRGAGRAVAHEIVHAVIPEYGHSDGRMDLMSPSWSCNSLLKQGVRLSPDFAAAFRARLSSLLARGA